MAIPITDVTISSFTVAVTWGANKLWKCYRLLGTAEVLAVSVWCNRCPLGILLDRLEEHPDECEAPAEVVRAAVEWMREKYQ